MSIARGWIRRGLAWPVLATGVVFILGVVVSLHLSAPNALAFGGCVKFCDPPPSSGSSGSSSGGGGWSTPRHVPRGPSPAERARQRREDAADVANSTGIKYRKMGDYDTAISYYKEAIRLAPNNSTYRENMGIAFTYKANKYFDKEDYDTAIHYYEEALRYMPNDPDIRESIRLLRSIKGSIKGKKANTIGVEYFNKGDYETAIKYFREALRFDPNGSVKQANLRNAEAKLKEQREEQVRERKLAESKTKVRRMLDNMSEEFGSSTLPKGSLGFMSPRKPLVAKGSKGSSSEGLQFMDPRQEGGAISDTGARLKSVKKTGKWAVSAKTIEEARAKAGLGFDDRGVKADPLNIPKVRGKAPGVYSKSPAVTDGDRKRIPSIVGFEKQRAQAINKLAAHQAKLEKLKSLPVDKRPKDWSVQRFNAIQAMTNAKSEIGAADVKIGDALRLNKGKAERKAELKRTLEPPPPPKTEKPKKKGKETWTLD
ncbi:MAG: tetratricopeptide repeat protein [bacterium]|nr:tetratricopeptide repeat protein [bacterium]